MFAVTLKLSNTMRNFPKLPVGLRTATKRSRRKTTTLRW